MLGMLVRAPEEPTSDRPSPFPCLGRVGVVVVNGPDVIGILSMRDLVRCWVSDGAICDVPSPLGGEDR
jgi:hypothetical protein